MKVGCVLLRLCGMLPKEVRGTTFAGLVHVTDWFPTFVALATDGAWEAKYANLPNNLDGVNMWGALTTVGGVSPRTTVIHGSTVGGAIRKDSFKLIVAQRDTGWTPVPSSATAVHAKDETGELINASTFKYARGGAANEGCGCTSGSRPLCDWLFNIETDPTETTNLCATQPERYAALKQELEAYTEAHQVECNTCQSEDPEAAAKAKETGYWLPWVGEPPAAGASASAFASAAATSQPDGGVGVEML